MAGSFHGRTAGALSLTHLGHYRERFPAVVRDVPAAPFGDLEALGALLGPDTAAVILEPIQSMAGVRVAADGYYPELVRRCHANGTLVIFDEVQTGVGRLGSSFAADGWSAPADLVTSARGSATACRWRRCWPPQRSRPPWRSATRAPPLAAGPVPRDRPRRPRGGGGGGAGRPRRRHGAGRSAAILGNCGFAAAPMSRDKAARRRW